MKVAIFPGSFDPINNGQLDIIKKAAGVFDKLIVLVVKNGDKKDLFSVESRLRFIRAVTLNFDNVEIDYWPKLLGEYLKLTRASTIIRGIKSNFDFDAELNFKILNETLNDSIQTIFMFPNPKNIYINSKLVKNLCVIKKNLNSVVPKIVEQEIKKEV